MKKFINERFYDSKYSDDNTTQKGSMKTFIDTIKTDSEYYIIRNNIAVINHVLRIHEQDDITSIQKLHSKKLEHYRRFVILENNHYLPNFWKKCAIVFNGFE